MPIFFSSTQKHTQNSWAHNHYISYPFHDLSRFKGYDCSYILCLLHQRVFGRLERLVEICHKISLPLSSTIGINVSTLHCLSNNSRNSKTPALKYSPFSRKVQKAATAPYFQRHYQSSSLTVCYQLLIGSGSMAPVSTKMRISCHWSGRNDQYCLENVHHQAKADSLELIYTVLPNMYRRLTESYWYLWCQELRKWWRSITWENYFLPGEDSSHTWSRISILTSSLN